jgi:hypothetical protein
MKLITEEVSNVKFITEGKGAEKKMYIEGIFLQGEHLQPQWSNVSHEHSFP